MNEPDDVFVECRTGEEDPSLLHMLLLILICSVLLSCSTGHSEERKAPQPSEILTAKHSRPLTDVTFEKTPERLRRGEYLTHGLYCVSCHTERDTSQPGFPPVMSKQFSGAMRYRTDSTWLYAPNITPDKETGAGNFTDDMLARAIREGVGHDGRSLVTPAYEGMPWENLRELTDEDLASIIVYLRSIPAIRNEIPKRNIGESLENRMVGRAYPLKKSIEEPDLNDPVERGKYLVSVSECFGCHTNWGKHNSGVFGGGLKFSESGDEFLFSPNISSDGTGIGKWTKEGFITVMRTGKGGVLNEVMPWITFRNLTDEDLGAIYEALLTTQPVKHMIMNRAPQTYCKKCDREHGLGEQNNLDSLVAFREDFYAPEDLSGIYISEMFERDSVKVTSAEGRISIQGRNKKWDFVPVSETRYMAEGFFAPIEFIENESGEVTDLQFHFLGRDVYHKLSQE